ncbi:MAG: LPS assembly protein LptD [Acidobacteriota bacterium]|nr:LPS assembly protein LptD [Acidobacteriota bacterium]
MLLTLASHVSAQVLSRPAKADLPPADEIWLSGVSQESNNEWRYLKGSSKVQTTEMSISADQIDYNSDTHWAYARGRVRLEHYKTGDIVNAEKAEFNLETDEGKFYGVTGTTPAKMMTNPAALSTTNPFYFQAAWVDRIKNRYILHHGFVTDCKMPKPWWTFQAPTFDIVPGDRAIARSAVFRLERVPILYLPFFRRPLGKNPRQSGFLTPNFGHTTLFGYVYGLGYYWAINRTYDMTAVGQYFTLRGPALLYNFRGKPNDLTDFNFNLYSVFDQGVPGTKPPIKEGGTQFELNARTQILGFTGRIELNYLSSYLFRQTFSYTFATAVQSEVYSFGYLQRHFKSDRYALNIAGERDQLFESATYLTQTPNQVVIQKLPFLEFSARDQQIVHGPLPVWFSFDSSAGILTRSEPTGTEAGGSPTQLAQTGVTGRFDVEPRVSTAFRFANFSLTPSIALGATDYTDSYSANSTVYTPTSSCGGYLFCPPIPTTTVALAGGNLFRKDADFTLDLRLPTIERIFVPPAWLHLGPKLKHVVETNATYEYVNGINQFQRIIHFDETDILSNTDQLTVSLTNRLYRKDKNGNVSEVVTWHLAQSRYFDPTFGGAVVSGVPGIGARNVVLAGEELTPFAFLDGPRNYSPVLSYLTVSPYPFLSFNWRADYDPLRGKVVDQTYGVSVRHSKYFASISDNAITTVPVLLPQANQITIGGGYGNTNRRGFNIGGLIDYDRLLNRRLYDFIQTSYNTNCCGFSLEVRQFNLGSPNTPGSRNENQYLFSFSVANIGTFGSLQRQERIF